MVVTDHNHHHHPTWPYIYIYIDKVKTNWKWYYIYSWDRQGRSTYANIYKCEKNSKVGLKWYKWKIIRLKSFLSLKWCFFVKRHCCLCLHSYGIINLAALRIFPNPHYSTNELLFISVYHVQNQLCKERLGVLIYHICNLTEPFFSVKMSHWYHPLW